MKESGSSPRVLLDTSAILRGILSPDTFDSLLIQLIGRYELLLSRNVRDELLAALSDDRLQSDISIEQRVTAEEIAEILARAPILDAPVPEPPFSKDRIDSLIQTAVENGADYVVTDEEETLRVREFRGVEVVPTSAFIAFLL